MQLLHVAFLALVSLKSITALTPINDTNIMGARDLWFSDKSRCIEDFGNISEWDTGAVTNMDILFKFKHDFNQDIGSWDVGSVTDME